MLRRVEASLESGDHCKLLSTGVVEAEFGHLYRTHDDGTMRRRELAAAPLLDMLARPAQSITAHRCKMRSTEYGSNFYSSTSTLCNIVKVLTSNMPLDIEGDIRDGLCLLVHRDYQERMEYAWARKGRCK